MGPRRERRGKLDRLNKLVADLTKLQWGHDASAVENAVGTLGSSGLDQLQWGHDASAVENTTGRSSTAATSSRFNGATTRAPWKTVVSPGSPATGVQLQWGHDASAVENAGPR